MPDTPADPAGAVIDADSQFWGRDAATIADTPLPKLTRMIVKYYNDSFNEEKTGIELLELATKQAQDKIDDVKDEDIKAQIAELRETASPNFYEIVLGMAMGGLGGALAASALKYALGKVLKNRLLFVTTVSKVRLSKDTATTQNLLKMRALAKKHGRKVKTKTGYHEMTSPAESINLSKNSWEGFLLEYGPKVGQMAADAGITQRLSDQLDTPFVAAPVMSVTDFFNKRVTDLAEQRWDMTLATSDLTESLVTDLELDPEIRHSMISTIKENREFEEDTNAADWWTQSSILSQPIIATTAYMSFFIPAEVLPYRAATHEFLYNGYVTVREARPSRAKASSLERKTLLELSKILYLLPELERNEFVTLFAKYGHEEHRAEIEVVHYFNRARERELAPKIESILRYLNDRADPFGPGHP